MITIILDKVILHAFHGVYKGEPLVGGDFEISLQVVYNDNGIDFNGLNDTISYVSLLSIVKERMKVPTPLLEKICKDVVDAIFSAYPFITEATISIFKLHPPIENFIGRVGVTMKKEFHD
jgi:dihydroneopterin aldolase